jgi:methylenetetrahydrofolate reductase (NADPH)
VIDGTTYLQDQPNPAAETGHAGQIRVSFEYFPPKSAEMSAQLWQAITALAPLKPRFVSVTYGAGGSTQDQTFATVLRMRRETPLEPAAHLTCVGATRGQIEDLLARYWESGIRHIVALRGDAPGGAPPGGPDGASPLVGGVEGAADLVVLIRRVAAFEISVAAYPETHPKAASPEADLDYLKRKLDAGAARAITQFFFDTATFLRFRDRTARAGIAAPLVPGILPVTNFAQVQRFSGMCGAKIPDWMFQLFDGLDADPATRKLVAAMVATEQCRALQAEGVDEFHFYTLNRPDLILGICRRLGLKPEPVSGLAEGLSGEAPPPQVDRSVP